MKRLGCSGFGTIVIPGNQPTSSATIPLAVLRGTTTTILIAALIAGGCGGDTARDFGSAK